MSRCEDDGASKAPQDRAKTYARFTRVRNGANEELRIGAEAYNGFDYVSIRLWTPGMDGSGELYPSRMSATIRRNELMQTIGALQAPAGSHQGAAAWIRRPDRLTTPDGAPSPHAQRGARLRT